MVFDILDSAFEISKARTQVGAEKLSNEILGGGVDERGKGEVASEDFLVDAKGVRIVIGRISNERFVGEDAESPPINGFAVAVGADDFWGEVFWRAAYGPRSVGTSF
jgi:hypothetical protein